MMSTSQLTRSQYLLNECMDHNLVICLLLTYKNPSSITSLHQNIGVDCTPTLGVFPVSALVPEMENIFPYVDSFDCETITTMTFKNKTDNILTNIHNGGRLTNKCGDCCSVKLSIHKAIGLRN